MPKRSSKKPGPPDANQLPKLIVSQATGEAKDKPVDELDLEGKNPAAVALGRLGGKKGGPARAAKLSAKERSDIARKAAEARWSAEKA